MTVRVYLPTTLPALAAAWTSEALPDVAERLRASEATEEAEYDALLGAAEESAGLVAGLPEGSRRRVVVVAEVAGEDDPVRWSDVVAVHVDLADDADPDEDLGWFATQEVGEILARL